MALEGIDSHNPAAWAFTPDIDVAFDYGRASFRQGPDVDLYRGHVGIPVPHIGGYAKIMGLSVSTRHTEMSRMGADTHVWGRQFGLGYGREVPLPEKIPGRLSAGFAAFPSDPSELRLAARGPDGKRRRIAHGRGQSKVGSIRLGLLYQPDEQFSFGAQYTHIKDDLWASYPGFGVPRTSDKYYVNLYTLGAAFRPDEKTVLLVQHLSGRAQGDGVRANYDIFSVGAERTLIDRLALRAGVLDGNLTCGFGVKLPYDLRIDYAFLARYGREVRRAFGQGPLHMIGIGKKF